jgi:hypothetical protein
MVLRAPARNRSNQSIEIEMAVVVGAKRAVFGVGGDAMEIYSPQHGDS